MLEMPNWIRVEIRWNTITASDATDWPFSQNGKLRPVFQDEATRPAHLYRFLFICMGHFCRATSDKANASRTGRGRITAELRSMRNPVPSTESIAERSEQAIKDLISFSEVR